MAGFTAFLWWVPNPELRLMPAFCAFIFAPYWVEAAFAAYVAMLFFATVLMLLDLWGALGDRKER